MNICVFCGSKAGNSLVYEESARNLGYFMAKNSLTLIYGGGNIGLMGILADAVMAEGGQAIGVIPEFLLEREVGHQHITRLEVVKSMHIRKQRMADLADAFIAIPGGWGTLEELAEILTWRQLNLIDQPIGVLNINNFFDPLLAQMRAMVNEGFLSAENFNLLLTENSVEKLLAQLLYK
jgi:uncharacterized protein (TIGR00730 family)